MCKTNNQRCACSQRQWLIAIGWTRQSMVGSFAYFHCQSLPCPPWLL
jgi:predicted Rdx family selenoprotein